MVHPLRCKAIASAWLKNDKVDAATLAHLLLLQRETRQLRGPATSPTRPASPRRKGAASPGRSGSARPTAACPYTAVAKRDQNGEHESPKELPGESRRSTEDARGPGLSPCESPTITRTPGME